jgi:integrase
VTPRPASPGADRLPSPRAGPSDKQGIAAGEAYVRLLGLGQTVAGSDLRLHLRNVVGARASARSTRGLPLDKAPAIRLEKEPEGRVRWLETDEQARLLAACGKSKNGQLAAIVRVALETGMRASEVMGLTWEESIDMTRGVIRLERTKSGRCREVPMRQAVYDLLAAIPEPRTGRLWPDESIRTAFENAVDAAKVGELTFHDLRHSFASWFVMRGGSLQALREILGHRDIKRTLRYAHLAPGHLRSEIDNGGARQHNFSTK